ncbi:MAG: HNH endonuclease [Alphaproteobacteria bacterium]|nr:HNH endonuclease [Alphaproteobacteria bacterium]
MTHDEIVGMISTMVMFSSHLTPTELRTLLKISIAHGKFPTCPFCGKPIKLIKELSLDHNNPKAKGGSSRLSNLQPMHISCNNLKADLTGQMLDAKKQEISEIKEYVEQMGFSFDVDSVVADEQNKCLKHKKKKHTKRRKTVFKPTNNVVNSGHGSR